jgi:hypothetical protein
LNFFILSNAKVRKKTNMQRKRRTENGGFEGARENSNANGGRRVEKKMG